VAKLAEDEAYEGEYSRFVEAMARSPTSRLATELREWWPSWQRMKPTRASTVGLSRQWPSAARCATTPRLWLRCADFRSYLQD